MAFPFAQIDFSQFGPAIESKVWESFIFFRACIQEHILMSFQGSGRKPERCPRIGNGVTQIVRPFAKHIQARTSGSYTDERSHVRDTAMFVNYILARLVARIVGSEASIFECNKFGAVACLYLDGRKISWSGRSRPSNLPDR